MPRAAAGTQQQAGQQPRGAQRTDSQTVSTPERSSDTGRRAAASVLRRARRDALGERSGPKRRKRSLPHTERQQGRKCRRRSPSWNTQPRAPSRAPQKGRTKHFPQTEERPASQTDGARGHRPAGAAPQGCTDTAHDLLTPHSETSFRTRTSSAGTSNPQGTPLKT